MSKDAKKFNVENVNETKLYTKNEAINFNKTKDCEYLGTTKVNRIKKNNIKKVNHNTITKNV